MTKYKTNERLVLLNEWKLLSYPFYNLEITGSMPRTYVLTHQNIMAMSKATTIDIQKILPYKKIFLKIPMDYEKNEDYSPLGLSKSNIKNLNLYAACKNDSFIFSEAHMSTGEYTFSPPIGTMSEYIEGYTLFDKPYDGSFSTLTKNMEKIAIDSEELTKNKIKIYDLNIANVINNNGKFKIIDCDDYVIKPKKTVEETRIHNEEAIDALLLSIVRVSLNYNTLDKSKRNIYLSLEKQLKEGVCTRTEYLDKLKNTLESQANTEIPTLNKGQKVINLYR